MKLPSAIIIVDDNPTNLKLLRVTLEAEGVKVLSAADGEEALEVLGREPVGAVISDILMPRMDGYRLCIELRKSEKFHDIPFIVYTSTYTSPGDEKAALDLGADVFLKKPSPVKDIFEAVEKAVNSAPRRKPGADLAQEEPALMKQYNARLVAKLEQKNAELQQQTQELVKAQEQLRLQARALETTASAIMVTDATGAIRWVNPAFSNLTGYTAAEAIGQNPRFLKSKKHDQAFFQKLWKTLLAGETWSGELANRRKDGTVFYGEQIITPVRATGGEVTHFIGIMNDISDRKQLEAQFIEAQKMEVVGQLAGGVAHDFNNILLVIMGYSDLMLSEMPAEDPLRKCVEEVRHAGERAAGLTRQLLVFSRKQSVQPVVLDLNQVVKELDKMLRRLTDEKIEMTMRPAEDLGRVKADPGYVGQVLMNLVVNARDAMPNGGKLVIATSNEELDEEHARATKGAQPGDYVVLSVIDTGTGIPDDVKAHMFEAFFTTKPKGKGTGLGLTTCQSIVQQSGGHISIITELGRGTTFKIYFPRVDQPLAETSGSAQSAPLPRGTETVLVVEDERSVRHLARGVLQSQGYDVLSASNGQDALHVAREHKETPIRLVVTDVVMPQMGGKVMAEWLRTTHPDLKILFTSGYTDDAISHHGVLDEGVDFLPKPYTPATLARKVREMLDAQGEKPK